MKLYKLTTQDNKTRKGGLNETTWGPGVSNTADLNQPAELCGLGVIHAYTDPLLAVFLNPIHANLDNPKLWLAEGEVEASAWDKVGVRTLTTIQEIKPVKPTTSQLVAFGILCALEVYDNPEFKTWAKNWLSGADRSASAARAANAAASSAWADRAAANAASAASAAWAASAAYAAASAAYAAAWAARAANAAASAAYWTGKKIDFVKIAYLAMEVK